MVSEHLKNIDTVVSEYTDGMEGWKALENTITIVSLLHNIVIELQTHIEKLEQRINITENDIYKLEYPDRN